MILPHRPYRNTAHRFQVIVLGLAAITISAVALAQTAALSVAPAKDPVPLRFAAGGAFEFVTEINNAGSYIANEGRRVTITGAGLFKALGEGVDWAIDVETVMIDGKSFAARKPLSTIDLLTDANGYAAGHVVSLTGLAQVQKPLVPNSPLYLVVDRFSEAVVTGLAALPPRLPPGPVKTGDALADTTAQVRSALSRLYPDVEITKALAPLAMEGLALDGAKFVIVASLNDTLTARIKGTPVTIRVKARTVFDTLSGLPTIATLTITGALQHADATGTVDYSITTRVTPRSIKRTL